MCDTTDFQEYKRTAADEMDWVEVNQLHEATLKISQNCFEFKKLCVALIGIAAVALGKLTSNTLDPSYFVVPFLIAFGFWIADFTAYYYQRVTRKRMSVRLHAIAIRNQLSNESFLSVDVSWFNSMFNLSMSLYFILMSLSLFAFILFSTGSIS
ncbi:hypothetical protein [Photobacterium carnosum]|uniref:hypothetical protein n=1 Tax=Photobacterium carnosum TaxID=2023717 RepID=UPI001E3DAD5A|nr:hypothetical protein [Photobacterium carnosum]MCD9498408.1 hypothetical protein [Photobacterium carnosum]MCD9531452.1 hypothetical protein [Photobacterium carnosum]MCD9551753.1 hypothetical protein [Photobacterium carnosum]MCF2155379.1 hypothetical protein [Photobacterium carnosum]MCF2217168.1 hypothetical protein [Photobacterium carnosum]